MATALQNKKELALELRELLDAHLPRNERSPRSYVIVISEGWWERLSALCDAAIKQARQEAGA